MHRDNPLSTLTLVQVREIYRRGGSVTRWLDIGVKVPGCIGDEIIVVSRQNSSGTYAYFKRTVLGKKGKFRQGMLNMHGSKGVVELVGNTPCAIGYSGLVHMTDQVKLLSLYWRREARNAGNRFLGWEPLSLCSSSTDVD